MKSPREPHDYPGRSLDCQEATREIFDAAVQTCMAAGWTRAEAILALSEISLKHVLEIKKTDEALRAARRLQ